MFYRITSLLISSILICLTVDSFFVYASDEGGIKTTVITKQKWEPEKKGTDTPPLTQSGTGEDDILTMSQSGKISDTDEKDSIDTPISKEEKEKVIQELNAYIIDSYKAQWTKIIKELDIKLQKTLPDTRERIEAYQKILTSLELRKKRLENMKASETKKLILREFLWHMIDTIEKKIDELEK